MTQAGLPYSDIGGSTLASSSPPLLAANHVLLRPLTPQASTMHPAHLLPSPLRRCPRFLSRSCLDREDCLLRYPMRLLTCWPLENEQRKWPGRLAPRPTPFLVRSVAG